MVTKPSNEEIEKALEQRARFITASPILAGAFDTLNEYRHWANEELELAAAQEKHLAEKIVEQRAQLTDRRSFGEITERLLADANEKGRVLQADTTNLRRDLRVANERIEVTQNSASRAQLEFDRRLKAKDAKIEEMERLNDEIVSENARVHRENQTLRAQLTPNTSAATLEAQIEALETPRKSTPLDKQVQVIQDCLTAMDEIQPAQRAAIAQYLVSRAHTAAWGAIPQQQAMPPSW
jgi:chromosome segregation ATPase